MQPPFVLVTAQTHCVASLLSPFSYIMHVCVVCSTTSHGRTHIFSIFCFAALLYVPFVCLASSAPALQTPSFAVSWSPSFFFRTAMRSIAPFGFLDLCLNGWCICREMLICYLLLHCTVEGNEIETLAQSLLAEMIGEVWLKLFLWFVLWSIEL